MKMNGIKIAGYYSVLVGISIIALWIIILSGEELPEGKTELTLHLFAEFLMAAVCVVSGILLLRRNFLGGPLNLIGLGMVVYSVLNAAGYYGQRNQTPLMIIFLVLFALTASVMTIHFPRRKAAA